MTHNQKTIHRVVEELADNNQTKAGALLGVGQNSVSRYLSGWPVRRSVLLLAELLLLISGETEVQV